MYRHNYFNTIYLYIYTFEYLYACIHTYLYVDIYIYIYINIHTYKHNRTEEIDIFCMNITEGPINAPLQKFKNFFSEKNYEKNLKIIIISHTEYLKKNELKKLDFLFRVTEKSFEYGNIVVLILWDLDVYDFGIKINKVIFFDGDNDNHDDDKRDENDDFESDVNVSYDTYIGDKFDNGDNGSEYDNDKRNDDNHEGGDNVTDSHISDGKVHDLRDLLGKEWSKVYMYIYIYVYVFYMYIHIHIFMGGY
jgi:hypothetical protein